jgi:hypothetical protein
MNIINDSFSSFNNVDLFHIMLADCCMLKSREWGPMVAVGQRGPRLMREVPLCRKKPISWSYSSYFAAAATMHHSPMMLLPGQRGTTTNLAWRLLCQWL